MMLPVRRQNNLKQRFSEVIRRTAGQIAVGQGMTSASAPVAIERLDARWMMDALPPSANAEPATLLQATNATFTVLYTDLDGVDTASLDNSDITISNGANTFVQAASVASIDSTDPTQVRVTYTFPAPGGTLEGADNGVYLVQLNSGQVRDLAGNTFTTPDGQSIPIGTVSVQLPTVISSGGPLTRISLTNGGRFQVNTAQFANGQFAPNSSGEANAGLLIRVNTPDGPQTYGFSATPFTSVLNFQSDDGLSLSAVASISGLLSVGITVSYTPGEDFARVILSFSNASDTDLTFDAFFVADLSLGDTGPGVGFFNPTTGGIGATDASGNYNIIFQGDPLLGDVFGPLPTHVKQGPASEILAVPLTPNGDFVPRTNATGQAETPTTAAPYTNDPNYKDVAAGIEWKGVTVTTGGETQTALRTFLMGFTSATTLGGSTSHVTGSVGAVASPQPGEASIVIPVLYTASGGVAASSLDDNDITVSGPNGFFATGRYLSQTTVGDVTTALYAVTGPAGGFSDTSSGVYTVTLADGAVTANQGGSQSLAGNIGTFSLTVGPKQGGIGTPDISFGQGGVVQVTLPAATIKSLDSVRQSDGTVLSAAYDATSGGLLITRFLDNGQIDPSFGVGGVIKTASPVNFTPRRVQLDAAAGRIYLLGAATDSGQPSVAAYDLNGNLDGGFGSGGVLSIPFFGPSDRVDSFVAVSGKLVGYLVGGALSTGSVMAATIVALNPDGSPNQKFGTDGAYSRDAVGPLDTIGSIAIGPKGEIYAAGTTSTGSVDAGNVSSGVLVIALSSNGKLSKAFNKSGEVVFSAPGFGIASGQKILVQSDGKLVVTAALATDAAAASSGNFGSGILRLTSKGALDTTIAGSGFSVIRQPGATVAASRVSTLASPVLDGDVRSVSDVLNAPDTLINVGGGKVRQLAADEAGTDSVITQTQVVVDALDLVASVLTVSNKKPYKVNAKVSSTVEVSNSGTLSSPGTVPIQVFRSADGVLDAGDELIGTIQVKAALKPGQTKKIKVTANAPGSEGTFFLFAKVNVGDGATSELALSNNTAAPSNSIVVTQSGKPPAPAGVIGSPALAPSGKLPALSATSELFSNDEISF